MKVYWERCRRSERQGLVWVNAFVDAPYRVYQMTFLRVYERGYIGFRPRLEVR